MSTGMQTFNFLPEFSGRFEQSLTKKKTLGAVARKQNFQTISSITFYCSLHCKWFKQTGIKPELGKVTLKSNGDEALSDEFLF
jgi:hypothetical protein